MRDRTSTAKSDSGEKLLPEPETLAAGRRHSPKPASTNAKCRRRSLFASSAQDFQNGATPMALRRAVMGCRKPAPCAPDREIHNCDLPQTGSPLRRKKQLRIPGCSRRRKRMVTEKSSFTIAPSFSLSPAFVIQPDKHSSMPSKKTDHRSAQHQPVPNAV